MKDKSIRMKQTFTNRSFDFVMMACLAYFLLDSVLMLFDGHTSFSGYLLPLFYLSISFLALLSLVSSKLDGERFSRFFIWITLIIPPALLYLMYLFNLVWYGANMIEFLQHPAPYVKLAAGIILLLLLNKFSQKGNHASIQDNALLIMLCGAFLVLYFSVATLESGVSFTGYPYISKTVLGLAMIMLGYLLKREKIKFRTCLIVLFVLMFLSQIG